MPANLSMSKTTKTNFFRWITSLIKQIKENTYIEMSAKQQNNFKAACRVISMPQNTLILFSSRMWFSDAKSKLLEVTQRLLKWTGNKYLFFFQQVHYLF